MSLQRYGMVLGVALLVLGGVLVGVGKYQAVTDPCEPGTYLSVSEARSPDPDTDEDPVPYESLSTTERKAFTDALENDASPLPSYEGEVDVRRYVRYQNTTYEVTTGALECGTPGIVSTILGGAGLLLGAFVAAIFYVWLKVEEGKTTES